MGQDTNLLNALNAPELKDLKVCNGSYSGHLGGTVEASSQTNGEHTGKGDQDELVTSLLEVDGDVRVGLRDLRKENVSKLHGNPRGRCAAVMMSNDVVSNLVKTLHGGHGVGAVDKRHCRRKDGVVESCKRGG